MIEDQPPPWLHAHIPYDPWGGPFKRTPPPDDAARELIRHVIAKHPHYGPEYVMAHLWRRNDITVDMVRTVHAEVNR